jgi:alcohol dehydrogenase (NADP+)
MDPSLMATHVYKGFDKLEEALLLMKDKPRDLIKPVVLLDE